MEIADNLSGNELNTAQIAEAKIVEGATEKINLGKFKDVGSLLNAYNSLEAEFTRRSQRLKEMEGTKKADKDAQSTVNINGTESTAADADLKTFISEGDLKNDNENENISDSEKNEKKENYDNMKIENEVKDFLQKFPDAAKFTKEISDIAANNKDYNSGFLQRAYVQLLQNRLSGSEKLLTDENHLKNVILNNSTLKEAVIREYLNKIKSGNKITLLSENGKGVITPPKKPKTIEQAGLLAKEFLTKK
jgi:hypothetical protein